MWLRRSSRWLTSATLLATLGLTARDAAAETLTPQQALEKAAQQNPALKASLLDIKAAKLAVASRAERARPRAGSGDQR
jgi:predicted outer membrane protein